MHACLWQFFKGVDNDHQDNRNQVGWSSRRASPDKLEICRNTFIEHLAARSYYVTSAHSHSSHQLLPRPSQNRAGAIYAHGSSTTHFTLKQTINSPEFADWEVNTVRAVY